MAKTETGRRNMKIPDDRIEEIKAVEKAATPGPWTGSIYELDAGVDGPTGAVCTTFDNDQNQNANGGDPIFIAMSRTAIPELLAEREEREGEIAALKKRISDTHACPACPEKTENPALKKEIEQHRQNAMSTITTQQNRIDDLVQRCTRHRTRAESAEKALGAVRDATVSMAGKKEIEDPCEAFAADVYDSGWGDAMAQIDRAILDAGKVKP